MQYTDIVDFWLFILILYSQGSSSEKIWLNSLTGCSAFQTCLTNCQGCPFTDVTICSHNEDVTLQCCKLFSPAVSHHAFLGPAWLQYIKSYFIILAYDSSKESSDGELYNFCDITDFTGNNNNYFGFK